MILYIRDPALFPLIIACAVLFLLFAGTLIAFLYVNKENEKKILSMLDEVRECEMDFTRIDALITGSCQVTYDKTDTEKVKNYCFDFNGVNELRAKLSVYPGANKIALYIKK